MRWRITVVKVNHELKRKAELAYNLAERAKSIEMYPLFPVPAELDKMVAGATSMEKSPRFFHRRWCRQLRRGHSGR